MDAPENKKMNLLTDEDLNKAKVLTEICQDLKKQLEAKLSKIQARTGFSLKQLKEFFQIKSNFSEDKWNLLEKQKAQFNVKYKGLTEYKSAIKKLPKTASKKKTKRLGNRARQRPNWLPM